MKRILETKEAVYAFDIDKGEFIVSAYDELFTSNTLDGLKRKIEKRERELK